MNLNTNDQTRWQWEMNQALSFKEMRLDCEIAFSKDMKNHTLQQFNIIEELVNSNLCENSKRRLVATVLKEIRDFFEESDSELRRVIGDQDLMEDFLAEREKLAPKIETEPSPF